MNEVIHVHATRQIGVAKIYIEEQLVYNAIVNKVENLHKTTLSIRSVHNFPNTPIFTIKHRLVHNKHVNVQIKNPNIPYLRVQDTSNNRSDFTQHTEFVIYTIYSITNYMQFKVEIFHNVIVSSSRGYMS